MAEWRASLAIGGFLLVYVLALGALLPVRYWDQDEFEHLQFAWLIGQGEIPYRDFFEHHTPLLQFALAPLLRLFGRPEQLVDVVPVLFRAISAAFTLMTAGMVAALAAPLGGRRAAMLAGLAFWAAI